MTKSASPSQTSPLRDINAVLADHSAELLARPEVVGVCVALANDGKTPCIKIMLSHADAASRKNFPRRLEGHPVMVEVTGKIQPLN